MAKGAHLKRTKVTLACGESVTVTELPGTRRVWELLQQFEGGGAQSAEALRELLEVSLGYEYTPEQIEAFYESGAINVLRGIEELLPILRAMHSALVPDGKPPGS